MEQQTMCKAFTYQLKPTPEWEQALEFVLRRCCELSHVALEERRDAWQKCGVSGSGAMQSAQPPTIKEAQPECRDIHSQVVQGAQTRLDPAF
jgi:putative transposase